MPPTSWTAVTNDFVTATATPYSTLAASANYVQGGAFASSEIRQDVALPAGYDYGTVVLTFARANMLADDTGTVTVEALSGGGTVLASATTGAEVFATLSTWYRRRLTLALPALTATVRVRLLATRTLGAGNSGAAFDDFDLRIHKAAEPVDLIDLDFRTPPTQPRAPTWPAYHLAWPTYPIPDGVISGEPAALASILSVPSPQAGQRIARSDGGSITLGTFTAPFSATESSAPCLEFARAVAGSAVDVQVTGGARPLGAFTLNDEFFTVRVVLRTDEPSWSTAAGLIGRRDNTGLGWGIQINASGQAVATIQSIAGTVTATSAASIADGAPHQVVLVYDGFTGYLRIYVDRRGYVEDTGGLGEFATAAATPLRIGRDGPASATGQLQILECQIIPAALTQAQVEAMWLIGSNPTAEATLSYSRDALAWGPAALDDDGHATLCAHATDQIAMGYSVTADLWGLAGVLNRTNVITSWDLSTWTRDAGATYAAITDCSGLARGGRFTLGASDGVRIATSTLTSVAAIRVAFWAKAAAAGTVNVRLKTSANVLVQSVAVSLTTSWRRYDVAFTSWAGATTTALIEWIGAITMDLAHVVGVYQPSAASLAVSPTLIGRPGVAFASGSVTLLNKAIHQAHSAEGEIDVTCALNVDETTSCGVAYTGPVASPSTNLQLRNARDMRISAGNPQLACYAGDFDSSLNAPTAAATGALDLSLSTRIRGRWRRSLGLPESSANTVGVSGAAGVASTVGYDSGAYVDNQTLQSVFTVIGRDTANRVFPGVIGRVRVMAAMDRA